MTNPTIYERHVAELKAELAICEAQARKLRALIDMYADLEEPNPTVAEAAIGTAVTHGEAEVSRSAGVGEITIRPTLEGEGRKAPRASPVRAELFERSVTEIMKEVGRPLSRDDIYTELLKKGIVFGGKEPVNAISTKLYRAREKFRLIPGQGYWLVDAPVPGDLTELTAGGSDQDDAAGDTPMKANGAHYDEQTFAAIFN